MTHGRKTGGRDFKPGNPGGPGRPKVPDDMKLAYIAVQQSRSALRFMWNLYYDELVHLPQSELLKLVGDKEHPADPQVPVLKLLVARSIVYAMSRGRAQDLLIHKDLMCGPEPKQFELSGPGGEPLTPFADFSQEKLAAAFTALDQLIKEAECKLMPNLPQPLELPAPSSAPGLDTES